MCFKYLSSNNPKHCTTKNKICLPFSSQHKLYRVKCNMHNCIHNLVFLRRNNLVIIKLFGKLVLIMFSGYQGYHFFFLQAKRKCATKTFTVYNNNEVGPFLCRIAIILYHSTWAEVWKQAVPHAVGNCWIHRFLSQPMNWLYII